MIAVVAKLKAHPGKEAEFEAVFSEMAAAVRADEPGAHVYQLARSRSEPGDYRVLEIYADDAALEAHRASDHFRAGGRKLRDLLAALPEVEVLDAVG